MTIRIEDAPSIKNIKIDISFDGDEVINKTQVITDTDMNKPIQTSDTRDIKNTKQNDIALNLSADTLDTPDISEEIIKAPIIEDIKRDVNVSQDMTDDEF